MGRGDSSAAMEMQLVAALWWHGEVEALGHGWRCCDDMEQGAGAVVLGSGVSVARARRGGALLRGLGATLERGHDGMGQRHCERR